jgi:NAD(P)-dependent dehydrogenase (short-subunit alcohol dehydrogenase family)
VTGRLDGKVALIFGAGSIGNDPSNGSATATVFAREGASVWCVDRSTEAAARTAADIDAEHGAGRAQAFTADVCHGDEVRAAVQACLARHGRIDVLHNNVGIEEFGDLTELTEASWDRVFATNLRGAMLASQAVMPQMIAQRGGSIINMSSIASKKWSPMQFLSYSASKAALNHMTRVVARQYASHQVRCNAIVAGLIDTPHAARLYPDAASAQAGQEARQQRCPMGCQGTPWDIAHAALFLASDESSYVTGLELVVDGGVSL